MVLLAINSLCQDADESNPLFRGLALKTLASLQQECITEHLERIIGAALSDKSAYVRRAAVFACVKLHQMSPSSVKETDLVDTLYGMIRDPDPIVVTNCLSALDEILEDEGGVVVNKAIAHYLLNRLSTFPTWSLVQVLTVLKKYSPVDDDEAFDIMNIADSCLENNSSTVVLACIELFLHLLDKLPHLQSEVFKRSQATLVSHLISDNVELTHAIIDAISRASHIALPHFYQSFQSFFCRNSDPLYLKLKKISLLPQLIVEENGEAILEELRLYCMNSSEDVCFHAIQAVRIAHQRKPFLSEACAAILAGLMGTSSLHVLSSLLQVLQNVQVTDQSFWDKLVSPIRHHFLAFTDSRAKAAALCLIGQHLQDSAEAFTVVEECVEGFGELDDRDVKIQLLTATARMFLAHPRELQGLLGTVLEEGVGDGDVEVRGRAEFLYSLLESGLDTARFILLGEQCGEGQGT
ncbi:AP-4 complex subunit beta-1-like [Babylonia areolata]|uniref:AP-4 complex subunit beta-1-like n=1 Tax=Babylonia areolata TaxID=304850 RepID=UPI003FCF0D0A